MKNPLTREQESLRGRKLADLTDSQLKLWIDACDRMIGWVKPARARRTWGTSRKDAIIEQAKRAERTGRIATMPANER